MKGMGYLDTLEKAMAYVNRNHAKPFREMPLYDKWQTCEILGGFNGNKRAAARMRLAQEVHMAFNMRWKLNGGGDLEFVPYQKTANAVVKEARDSGMEGSLTVLTLRVVRDFMESDHVRTTRKEELIALCKDPGRREEAVEAVFDLLMRRERFGYAIVVGVLCGVDEAKVSDAIMKEARKRSEDNRKGKGERQLAIHLWGD